MINSAFPYNLGRKKGDPPSAPTILPREYTTKIDPPGPSCVMKFWLLPLPSWVLIYKSLLTPWYFILLIPHKIDWLEL